MVEWFGALETLAVELEILLWTRFPLIQRSLGLKVSPSDDARLESGMNRSSADCLHVLLEGHSGFPFL